MPQPPANGGSTSTTAPSSTLVLVAFGVFQILALNNQDKLTRKSVDAARATATSAARSVWEATRARIDEQASRVVVQFEQPEWPPYVVRASNWAPQQIGLAQHRVLTIHDPGRAAGVEYSFSADDEQLMWLLVKGVVINEVSTTARVALEGEARFIEGSSSLVPDLEGLKVPPTVGGY